MNRVLAVLAALILTSVTVSSTGFAADFDDIRFTAEPSRNGQVQLSLSRDRSNWSTSFAPAELQGLAPHQLRDGGSGQAVQFSLVREAGRLDCQGQSSGSRATGRCNFATDERFAALLSGRGIGQPSVEQAYALTLSGVGRAHLDALAENRYPAPTLDQLVAMGIHGATPAFIRDLARGGYRLQSAEDLVTFRIHGVDAAYIGALAAASPGLGQLDADDLVSFRIHGVSPELLAAYSRLGYRSLDRKDVVAMAIHGVTPAYIEALAQVGYRDLRADDLVKLRILGVTADDARMLARDSGGLPSADELVQSRIGVERRN